MKIVLGMTMFNEINYGPHVWLQMDHILDMDYDDIVIVDDGSTDGTYDVLKYYESKNKRLHIYKNNVNSITSRGSSRWPFLWHCMSQYNPGWINIRAADQVYSFHLKEDLRSIVKEYHNSPYNLLNMPMAHLWRSYYWFRDEYEWGRHARGEIKSQLIRFNPNWSYEKTYKIARLHQGNHIPQKLGYVKTMRKINTNVPRLKGNNYKYIILHLGHTTHEKKEQKFRWTMEAVTKGEARNVPSPKVMPHPTEWLKFAGYKGFYEFRLTLSIAPDEWLYGDIPEYVQNADDDSYPSVKSFYNVINEFNYDRAEQYKSIFEKCYDKDGQPIKNLDVKVKTLLNNIERNAYKVSGHPLPPPRDISVPRYFGRVGGKYVGE